MCSLTARKAGIATAVLGFVLGVPGLRAEGFDILCYKNYAPGFPEFCEHIAGLGAGSIKFHWEGLVSSPYDSYDKWVYCPFSKRHGRECQYEGKLIYLSGDEKSVPKSRKRLHPEPQVRKTYANIWRFCAIHVLRGYFFRRMYLNGYPKDHIKAGCVVTLRRRSLKKAVRRLLISENILSIL